MSRSTTPVTVLRDTPATTVPAGERVMLDAGCQVVIVQRLGGNTTVRTEVGALLRIAGADSDALGLGVQISLGRDEVDPDAEFSLDAVTAALRTVYDPEIPIDIVELGLVYRCEEVTDESGSRNIEVDMSMTAPGCGMGDVLRADAESAVLEVPGVDRVDVTLVWDPPWTMSRMSEAARLQLGIL